MKKYIILLFVMVCSLIRAGEFEQWTDKYDQLIKSAVSSGTRQGINSTLVDYDSLSKNPVVQDLYYQLETIGDPYMLKRDDQLAFWINAYNFLTIYKVAQEPEIEKLTDLNGLFKNVWKIDAGEIAGEDVTLDQIEHEIIRKKFKEPRIHMAVVCAALSCPDLRPEAFRGEMLDAQLADQLMILATNNKKGIMVDSNKKIIYVSKIFSWFSGDFGGDVKKWLYKHGLISKEVSSEYSVKYFDYNWSLNKKGL